MNVIISGGTGFIGSALVNALMNERHKVILLAREPEKYKDRRQALLQIERWDGKSTGQWKQLVEGADAIVNIAGASIAGGRWTKERKAVLLQSRLDPTKAIVNAIRQSKHKPSVLINASAVGYYGDVLTGDVTETDPRGSDFLAQLCGEWEKAASEAAEFGVRVVFLRLGIVLGKGGGALPRLVLPFKLYAGGWLGSGAQWFPWVHLDDVTAVVGTALADKNFAGPVNVVAPELLTQKEFSLLIGKILGKPCWAPVPAPVLRGLLGEMAGMLLGGQKVVAARLAEHGYAFKYPKAEEALRSILPAK